MATENRFRDRKDSRGRKGKYIPRRKVCAFCVDKVDAIDYKDVGLLSKYISDRGRIEPRRRTGTCARHQRALSTALKRARFIALLPYTVGHIRESGIVPHREASRESSRESSREALRETPRET